MISAKVAPGTALVDMGATSGERKPRLAGLNTGVISEAPEAGTEKEAGGQPETNGKALVDTSQGIETATMNGKTDSPEVGGQPETNGEALVDTSQGMKTAAMHSQTDESNSDDDDC